ESARWQCEQCEPEALHGRHPRGCHSNPSAICRPVHPIPQLVPLSLETFDQRRRSPEREWAPTDRGGNPKSRVRVREVTAVGCSTRKTQGGGHEQGLLLV